MDDLISRQVALHALCEACDFFGSEEECFYKKHGACYERNAIMSVPTAPPTLYGYNIEHLELIARVLQKEDLPPERIAEVIKNIGRIVAIVKDEYEEVLRKAVEQCTI